MDKQEYEVRDMRFLDDDLKKKVSDKEVTGGESFVIKAILPVDRRVIINLVAQLQAHETSAYSYDDRALFERHATVGRMVESGPDWWKGIDLCADEDLIDWLFARVQEWTMEWQQNLKKNKLSKRSPEGKVS